jgi:hypothetical protein
MVLAGCFLGWPSPGPGPGPERSLAWPDLALALTLGG